MSKESNQFGNRPQPLSKNKEGSRNKRTLMLEALHREVVDEFGDTFESKEAAELAFVQKLVRRAQDAKDKASLMFSKEILDRLCPTDKATLPVYTFELGEEGSPSERIAAVALAVSRGEIPPDVGNIMVNMISAGVKVEETTELMERISRLEQMLQELDKE